MNLLAYNLFLHTVAAPFLAAYYAPQIMFKGKYRNSLSGKLGKIAADFPLRPLRRPRIWFHAVSVGEVTALNPLVQAVKELVPESSVIVSTGTETGQQKARESIKNADGFLYMPLDFPEFLNPVIKTIDPDLFVLMETELWPNLIHLLKHRGTMLAIANGRISDRSFPRYRKLRRFFSSTLEKLDLLLMSTDTDAARIRDMGAPETAIHVTGNTKFDAALTALPSIPDPQLCAALELTGEEPVLVAGSIHPGEFEILLDAYDSLTARFPELILILVPRHIERTPQILALINEKKLDAPLLKTAADRGEKRNGRSIIVVDKIGELFQIFSLASVVFIGGSLVKRGGQNILEPAAWGKVVLFGPSMEDFREARDALVSAGAGIQVRDTSDLVRWVAAMLSDRSDAEERGMRGKQEIMKHIGSSRRNAQILVNSLKARRIDRQ
ncbi:3-deoxy-D-manno-octulosonic acid transferase [Desulfomonile tiedjei]|uniref:3-deoxy-D-manno-octulosonic acid transferase n=1 Tax=Desulfomonile tiedjei (strain ATCC 49306 / DSM 6799 / DCB-1) TaxID=706587 RepID=I4C2S6_DESTA|nr:3-deoxy-D-manno-octulosonic acid transferase [Desulfomonile tiedjei]AFM23867.1 3-deoxy-D-manno-octulosonic-acid transferase [Desulfomonile tiedjei DSM 6799]